MEAGDKYNDDSNDYYDGNGNGNDDDSGDCNVMIIVIEIIFGSGQDTRTHLGPVQVERLQQPVVGLPPALKLQSTDGVVHVL